MSEQAGEQQQPAAVADAFLPPSDDAAFALVMDLVAAEPDEAAGGEGTATTDAPAGGDGQSAPAAEGAGAAGGAPAAPAAGDAGGAAVPPADAAGGAGAADAGAVAGDGVTPAAPAGERPAEWTRPAAELTAKIEEAAVALETRTQDGFKVTELEAVRTEYPQYFDAISKHPRELVGVEVNRIDGKGKETLRDSEDAKEWQEAAKLLLAREVQGRVESKMEENSGYLDTLHQSIDLFRNNLDLIPGTAEFDVDLANRLTRLVDPYAVRVEGKLHGYSIPLQPLVEKIRDELKAEREKAPAAPSPAAGAPAAGAAASTPAAPAAPPKAGDLPQAGIQSKAGESGEGKEDFSTLWGTLGLPDLVL